MPSHPKDAESKVNVGDRLGGFTRLVDQTRINAYAEASGDHNPIHLDESFARTTRFGQRIAHGMLSLAFVWEMIADEFPRGYQRSCMVKVRFTSPVIPGETVVVGGSVTKVTDSNIECDTEVIRPNGESALSGTAIVPLNC